eukprot:scaffold1499_cov255-Pinguiococcus_pyrenoidosus.AAC.17
MKASQGEINISSRLQISSKTTSESVKRHRSGRILELSRGCHGDRRAQMLLNVPRLVHGGCGALRLRSAILALLVKERVRGVIRAWELPCHQQVPIDCREERLAHDVLRDIVPRPQAIRRVLLEQAIEQGPGVLVEVLLAAKLERREEDLLVGVPDVASFEGRRPAQQLVGHDSQGPPVRSLAVPIPPGLQIVQRNLVAGRAPSRRGSCAALLLLLQPLLSFLRRSPESHRQHLRRGVVRRAQ